MTYVTLKDGDTATVGALSSPDSYAIQVSTTLGLTGYTGSAGGVGPVGYTGSRGLPANTGTLTFSNNTIGTSNNSTPITITAGPAPVNMISNNFVQMQYNANTLVGDWYTNGTSWAYVSQDMFAAESFNNQGARTTGLYVGGEGSNSLLIASADKLWRFTPRGFVFPDSTTQTTAYIKQVPNLDGGAASVVYDADIVFVDGGSSSTRYGVGDPTFSGGNRLTETNQYTLNGGGA